MENSPGEHDLSSEIGATAETQNESKDLVKEGVEETRRKIREIVRETGERGKDYFELGDRVKLIMLSNLNLTGEIVDIQEAIIMDNAVLASENYKAKWDNPEHGESGWLSAREFKSI